MNIKEIQQEIHKVNVEKGFWEDRKNVGEVLMLIVSELGEALEAHRSNKHAAVWAFDARAVDRTEPNDFVADVDIDMLRELNQFGSVRNLRDRRKDLFELRKK